MRLNDKMIDNIEFKGKTYKIDLAFDNVLDVFDIIRNHELFEVEKVHLGLVLLLGDVDVDEPLELWNYINKEVISKGKRKAIQYDILGNVIPDVNEEEDNEEYFDIEQDADLIYASFLAEYNIDLFEQQGKMHWHVFQALLQGLSSECILQRVIQVRLWKPQKGDSSQYRADMRKLQNYYKLIPKEE